MTFLTASQEKPPQKGQRAEGTEAQRSKTQRAEHPRQRNRRKQLSKCPGVGLAGYVKS